MPIANTAEKALSPGTGNSALSDTINNGGDNNATCEASGNVLSWLLCPIINGSLDGAAWIFTNYIEPYLEVKPLDYSNGDNNILLNTWRSFRAIANIVLLFALLFIVFSQAIGGGIVDAYTAKKVLPRVLIAAILINLSFYICGILVDIFNIIGNSMVSLILSPMKNSGDLNFKLNPGGAAGNFVAIVGLLAAGVGAYFLVDGRKVGQPSDTTTAGSSSSVGSILPYVLLFVVLPVIIAAFSVFVTLLIRRGAIYLLIILSPVALALYALPATEQYAKKWFSTFWKTLLVYPIITTVFAISQLTAVLIYDGNETSLVVLIAMVICAFFPLFIIPFSFKLAGGLAATITGAVAGGKDKLNKMYGNDKHNPYSTRAQWFHKGKEVHGPLGQIWKGMSVGGAAGAAKGGNVTRRGNAALRREKRRANRTSQQPPSIGGGSGPSGPTGPAIPPIGPTPVVPTTGPTPVSPTSPFNPFLLPPSGPAASGPTRTTIPRGTPGAPAGASTSTPPPPPPPPGGVPGSTVLPKVAPWTPSSPGSSGGSPTKSPVPGGAGYGTNSSSPTSGNNKPAPQDPKSTFNPGSDKTPSFAPPREENRIPDASAPPTPIFSRNPTQPVIVNPTPPNNNTPPTDMPS